jgi:hypothetical protein
MIGKIFWGCVGAAIAWWLLRRHHSERSAARKALRWQQQPQIDQPSDKCAGGAV